MTIQRRVNPAIVATAILCLLAGGFVQSTVLAPNNLSASVTSQACHVGPAAGTYTCTVIVDASSPSPSPSPSAAPSVSPAPTSTGLLPTPSLPPTPAPTPTPTIAPTPSPSGGLARPWPLPVTTTTVNVPASIDATGATDVTAALSAFIQAQPMGTVINFPAAGIYRISSGIDVRGKANVIIDGHGATLNNTANANVGSSEPLGFFYGAAPGHSGTPATHLTIRNFVAKAASPHPGTYQVGEFAAFFTQYGGSYLEVSGVTASGLFGDLATFNLGAQYIWIHDNHGITIGRNNVSIVWASHVLIENNAFDTAGYTAFDIEPEVSSIGSALTDIVFRNNVVGTWSNTFVSADGQPGTTVSNVTISGNTLTGSSMYTIINLARRTGITITGNRSLKAAAGPIFELAHIDGLTVTGNTQPLTSGSLFSLSDCPGSVTSPNP